MAHFDTLDPIMLKLKNPWTLSDTYSAGGYFKSEKPIFRVINAGTYCRMPVQIIVQNKNKNVGGCLKILNQIC